MALFVLLGFGLLFTLAFDEGFQGEGITIEAEIANQAKAINGYMSQSEAGNLQLAGTSARLATAKQLEQTVRTRTSQADQIATIKSKVVKQKATLETKVAEFEAYKDRYRAFARGNAKGQEIVKLETLRGEIYNNVSIREVTAVGIQIRHDEGQKRIPFEELPIAMRDTFQFDPSQKKAALVAESKARDQHDAAVMAAGEVADEQMTQQRAEDAAEAKSKLVQRIASTEAHLRIIAQEINDLENQRDRAQAEAASARAAGNIHVNKSNGIASKIRLKQNRLAQLRSEVGQMKSQL